MSISGSVVALRRGSDGAQGVGEEGRGPGLPFFTEGATQASFSLKENILLFCFRR